MTDLVKHNSSTLTDQIEWTRLVTDGDRAGSLLPDTYKGKPANVLIAVGLGASMGLSPAESLYRIAVIKGKPTAGAELIAANVRKAGHKLRVTTGDGPSVTATIIRSDDPDFPFSVTRDLAWAQRMGLAQNDNYKKQPETMLQWRAISAVARLACPEALYGVQYTPDEVSEVNEAEPTARRTVTSETFTPAPADAPSATTNDEAVEATLEPDEPMLTDRTRKAMFALIGEIDPDATDEAQRNGIAQIIGRPVESRKTLTEAEGQQVVDHLRAVKRQREIAAEMGAEQ